MMSGLLILINLDNIYLTCLFQTNNRTKAQQRSAKLVIDKALKEDATIFQYDEVYDEIDKKKENNEEKKKKADNKVQAIYYQ